MDLDMQSWMAALTAALRQAFGARLVCVGLQGSRARGEAGPQSDIDAVVLLDHLAMADLDTYRAILDALPARSLACGFVSGVDILCAWDKAELFQFCQDTDVVYGSLEAALAVIPPDAARQAVHRGACAIYHACCHNYLHAQAALDGLTKSLWFTLQAKYFCDTGRYIRRHRDLLPVLPPAEQALLTAQPGCLGEHTARLLDWAAACIQAYATPH